MARTTLGRLGAANLYTNCWPSLKSIFTFTVLHLYLSVCFFPCVPPSWATSVGYLVCAIPAKRNKELMFYLPPVIVSCLFEDLWAGILFEPNNHGLNNPPPVFVFLPCFPSVKQPQKVIPEAFSVPWFRSVATTPKSSLPLQRFQYLSSFMSYWKTYFLWMKKRVFWYVLKAWF